MGAMGCRTAMALKNRPLEAASPSRQGWLRRWVFGVPRYRRGSPRRSRSGLWGKRSCPPTASQERWSEGAVAGMASSWGETRRPSTKPGAAMLAAQGCSGTSPHPRPREGALHERTGESRDLRILRKKSGRVKLVLDVFLLHILLHIGSGAAPSRAASAV